jgi:hypothetical protein
MSLSFLTLSCYLYLSRLGTERTKEFGFLMFSPIFGAGRTWLLSKRDPKTNGREPPTAKNWFQEGDLAPTHYLLIPLLSLPLTE